MLQKNRDKEKKETCLSFMGFKGWFVLGVFFGQDEQQTSEDAGNNKEKEVSIHLLLLFPKENRVGTNPTCFQVQLPAHRRANM